MTINKLNLRNLKNYKNTIEKAILVPNGYVSEIVDVVNSLTEGTSELAYEAESLTAGTTQTQAFAVASKTLNSEYSAVAVTTAGDVVALPAVDTTLTGSIRRVIRNTDTSKYLTVYPHTGETINDDTPTANLPFIILPKSTMEFQSVPGTTTWGIINKNVEIGYGTAVVKPYTKQSGASSTLSVEGGTTLANNTAGGTATIKAGAGVGNGAGGAVYVTGGTPGATGIGGAAYIESGAGGSTSGASGRIYIRTATETGTDASGRIDITSGGAATANSGYVVIGSGTATTGTTGNVYLASGTATTGNSGTNNLTTGETTTGNSGELQILTGNVVTLGNTGRIVISSGISSTSGNSGDVGMSSGSAVTGNTGALGLNTGGCTTGNSGNISITTGNTAAGATGDINITAGNGTTTSGSVILTAGNGGTDGVVTINTNGTDRWTINSSGSLVPTGSMDVGSVAANVGDVHISSGVKAYGAMVGTRGIADATCTLVTYGDGKNFVSVITLTNFIVGTIPGAGALSVGNLIFTFPAGYHTEEHIFSNVGFTIVGTGQTPVWGIGSTQGAGAFAVLNGTATQMDYITEQTAADSAGTPDPTLLPATAGLYTGIALSVTASAKTVYLNAAETWAADNAGDLLANGTITIKWTKMS